MFFEPERSQYDLRFQLFGIDVRVHPWFWLVSAIMGWNSVQEGFSYLFVWIACVFVSVLIHELGHVFMGRLFGARGHIVLYSFGGLAIGSSALRHRWQRIAVYFAGPLAGFLVYGLIRWGAVYLIRRTMSPLVAAALVDLIWINLYWGILNLLPVWPLDGGKISRDLLEGLMPANGVRVALGISLVTAGLLAFVALVNEYSRETPALIERIPLLRLVRGFYMALLFGSLAFTSYEAIQIEGQRKPWDRHGDPWDSQ